MIKLPTIYYSNGAFLVYNREDALNLREKRIVGQLIGCSPRSPHQIISSGLPCSFNHYAISVVLSKGFARIVELVQPPSQHKEEQNTLKFNERLEKLKATVYTEFQDKRAQELRRRGIEPTPERVGNFNYERLKYSVPNEPETELRTCEEVELDDDKIRSFLWVDRKKLHLFQNLYDKGFYITAGTKFGADFLAYQGDPVRYHAKYAARVVPCDNGTIDKTKMSYGELNAFHRLCHTANKIALLCLVDDGLGIKYVTLKTREYLSPTSLGDELVVIESLSCDENSQDVCDTSKKTRR